MDTAARDRLIARVTPERLAKALEAYKTNDGRGPSKEVETWRGGAVIAHSTGNGAWLPWEQETFQDAYALGIRDGWTLMIKTGSEETDTYETETHRIDLWALCASDLIGYQADEQEAMADVIAEAAAEKIYQALKPVQEEYEFLAANGLYKTTDGRYHAIEGAA